MRIQTCGEPSWQWSNHCTEDSLDHFSVHVRKGCHFPRSRMVVHPAEVEHSWSIFPIGVWRRDHANAVFLLRKAAPDGMQNLCSNGKMLWIAPRAQRIPGTACMGRGALL